MGYMVNEIKDAVSGRDRGDESVESILARAFERSGAGASFADVASAVDKLSDYGAGAGQVLGVVGGPTGSNTAKILSVARDFAELDPDVQTAKDILRLMPGNNLTPIVPLRNALTEAP